MSGEDEEDAIRLHPLVIMNVADHHEREVEVIKSEKKEDKDLRVIGLLFGIQKGRHIEILNSTEIAHAIGPKGEISMNDKDISIVADDLKLIKEVYPNYECLGWYTTAEKPTNNHLEFHRKHISRYNENPLFLIISAKPSTDQRSLPIFLYEAQVRMIKDEFKSDFIERKYKVFADEAERVTVDHIAKVSVGDTTGESTLTPTFISMRESTKMLLNCIRLITQYLQDVKAEKIPFNNTILRKLKTLCNRLPAACEDQFYPQYYKELNDTLLVVYMASITKGFSEVTSLIEKSDAIRALSNMPGHGHKMMGMKFDKRRGRSNYFQQFTRGFKTKLFGT